MWETRQTVRSASPDGSIEAQTFRLVRVRSRSSGFRTYRDSRSPRTAARATEREPKSPESGAEASQPSKPDRRPPGTKGRSCAADGNSSTTGSSPSSSSSSAIRAAAMPRRQWSAAADRCRRRANAMTPSPSWMSSSEISGSSTTTNLRDLTREGPLAGALSSKNRRRPTLPGGCPPSTIGAAELNFSVRNGKRCFLCAIAPPEICRDYVAPMKLKNCTMTH